MTDLRPLSRVYLRDLAIEDKDAALRRLMIAQDTGGAITGPVRGDVFWGFGSEAESRAGGMRARGRYSLTIACLFLLILVGAGLGLPRRAIVVVPIVVAIVVSVREMRRL